MAGYGKVYRALTTSLDRLVWVVVDHLRSRRTELGKQPGPILRYITTLSRHQDDELERVVDEQFYRLGDSQPQCRLQTQSYFLCSYLRCVYYHNV